MATTPNELHRTITIRAPRERVWAALTELELLVRWFPPMEVTPA